MENTTNRRLAPRYQVNIEAKICKLAPNKPNNTGAVICGGLIHDISITGVSFLSNEEFNNQDEICIVKFSFLSEETFYLPVKLIRTGEFPRNIEYKNDYAFLIDYENNPEELQKLTLALFKFKMDSV